MCIHATKLASQNIQPSHSPHKKKPLSCIRIRELFLSHSSSRLTKTNSWWHGIYTNHLDVFSSYEWIFIMRADIITEDSYPNTYTLSPRIFVRLRYLFILCRTCASAYAYNIIHISSSSSSRFESPHLSHLVVLLTLCFLCYTTPHHTTSASSYPPTPAHQRASHPPPSGISRQ